MEDKTVSLRLDSAFFNLKKKYLILPDRGKSVHFYSKDQSGIFENEVQKKLYKFNAKHTIYTVEDKTPILSIIL